MNIRCCVVVAVIVGVAATSSAQPLDGARGRSTFASAMRLLRAVEQLDAPYDVPAKQRAVIACRDAHVALWRGGLEARIVRASGDAPAAPRDLDAFWGLAVCTEAFADVQSEGSRERIAAQRDALAHYERYMALEDRDGHRASVSSAFASIELLRGALPQEEPEPIRGPAIVVRPEAKGDKNPALRSVILDGFAKEEQEEYEECYAWFHTLILSEDLEERLAQHTGGVDIAFTAHDVDILLGNARCAEGTLTTVEGGEEGLQQRIHEAAHYYAAYASLDRRKGHEQDVQDADARARALYARYQATLDRQVALAAGRAYPSPSVRTPVTTLTPLKDQQMQFAEALVGANSMLALGYLPHAYTSYDILTQNPIGKDSPDVAWGMAKTTELSCAAIDDDALRLHWLGVSRRWYARYMDMERRPEHIQGAEARVTRARIAHGELERRIAALEEKVAAQDRLRAAAAAAASRGPLDGVGAGDGATSASATIGGIPDDGGAQDVQLPVATTSGAAPGNNPPSPQSSPPPAVPPAIAAFQCSHPEYTLAELLCFTRYKMCRERMEIRHGFFYFYYDQFPPHGTQCPP